MDIARRARAGRAVLLAVLVLGLTACARVPGVYVVVHPSPGSGGAAAFVDGGTFNAQGYVNGIWSSRVLPAYRTRAVSAPALISALAANAASACTRYGNVTAQDSPCAFMIKGTGRVTAVASSLSGTDLTIELSPGGAKQTVEVETGPAFTGTAVRDAIPFIKFAQYTNQVNYADVGIELNDMVRTRVIGNTSFAQSRGRTVTFIGATEGSDPKGIVVTPVVLSLGPS